MAKKSSCNKVLKIFFVEGSKYNGGFPLLQINVVFWNHSIKRSKEGENPYEGCHWGMGGGVSDMLEYVSPKPTPLSAS